MDKKDAVVVGGDAAQPGGGKIEVAAEKEITNLLKVEKYNFSHKHRGKAIIINNRNFLPESGQNDRMGTDLDAEKLESLFCKMGFDVLRFDNLRVMDMYMELGKAADDEDYNNDADCFVCVMLSHGKDSNIFGIDRKTGIDSFTSKFTGDKCPSLAGKPKLFFIQACRGIKLDPGVEVKLDEIDAGKDETDSAEAPLCHIPIHADFLMSYAVVPGHFAFINTHDGSWFVQAICRVFNECWETLDLLEMMTLVNKVVAFEFRSYTDSYFDNNMKQCPCFSSMLTKKVYFKRD